MHLYARPSGRADAHPVQPERIPAGDPVFPVERQEVAQGVLLAAIEHVALILRDDERQPRDLGGEVADFDAAKVGERDVALAVGLAAPLVDLGFDRAHLLVGDDEEVARAAGRVEDPDTRHAVAQVQKLPGIVAGLFQLLAQVVEEERVEHLQDVGHAGVVHAERPALLVVGHCLDHRTENVGVDELPIQVADVKQIRPRDLRKTRHLD